MAAELPELTFPTPAALEAWLEEHHATSSGIWLTLAKKGTGVASVTYAEAVDLALCFGWIDGQARRKDAIWYHVRFTPRRPRSVWSKINTGKAEALVAAGRMRPSGQRQIDAARADGRWERAYSGSATAQVPDDLRAALDAVPGAAEAFAGLDSTNRYAVIYRVNEAKKPDTRQRRIEKYVAMLAAGEKLHP